MEGRTMTRDSSGNTLRHNAVRGNGCWMYWQMTKNAISATMHIRARSMLPKPREPKYSFTSAGPVWKIRRAPDVVMEE